MNSHMIAAALSRPERAWNCVRLNPVPFSLGAMRRCEFIKRIMPRDLWAPVSG